MATEAELLALVKMFADRVRDLEIGDPSRWTVGELRSIGQNFVGHSAGIYYFLQANEIVYVGRALRSVGLAARVRSNLSSFGDPKWDAVIKDDLAMVGTLTFPNDDWHWVAALECFLIDKLGRPRFNKRYA